MRIWQGASLLLLCCLLLVPAAHAAPDAKACLVCHGAMQGSVEKEKGVLVGLGVDADKYSKSVHGSFACSDCHMSYTAQPHKGPAAPVDKAVQELANAISPKSKVDAVAQAACVNCHPDPYAAYKASVHGARSVLSVLDPARYEVIQIGITHEGTWLTGEDVIGRFEQHNLEGLAHYILSPDPSDSKDAPAVFFPVLHGTFGEDGTIQGLFEMADVAYVGAGVTASSVCMDKGVFKEVMRANDIPVVESLLLLRSAIEKDVNAVIEKAEHVGAYPLFTKPANLGSSVGVTKCHNRSDLQEGLMEAASFDRRVLIERGVMNAREIEVSVLGNDDPVASVCGEILPSREFYSYESKYIDGTSGLEIPAVRGSSAPSGPVHAYEADGKRTEVPGAEAGQGLPSGSVGE